MIIGIFGAKQVGKDTAGKLIQRIILEASGIDFSGLDTHLHDRLLHCQPFTIHKFAKPLKQILSILTGIPVADMEKEEVKNRKLGEEWFVLSLYSFGELLKVFNTVEELKAWTSKEGWEVGYDCEYRVELPTLREALELIGTGLFRNQFHPNTWINAAFADYTDQNWIFADGRFQNEADEIKEFGGFTIKIEKETGRETSLAETELDGLVADYTITNNGSLEELKTALKVVPKKEGLL